MLNKIIPEKGNILISEPFMLDSNFKRSVILITDYTDNGHVGYIINQKSDFLLRDIIPDCWDANFQVYFGGPVANDTLHFVHACPDKIEGGIALGNGLFWGGDFESLKLQINSYALKEEEIKFFIGYSGWTAKQLVDEIKENSWIVSDRYNPDIIFDYSDVNIWKEAIINMGQKYAHIANFPEDPALN